MRSLFVVALVLGATACSPAQLVAHAPYTIGPLTQEMVDMTLDGDLSTGLTCAYDTAFGGSWGIDQSCHVLYSLASGAQFIGTVDVELASADDGCTGGKVWVRNIDNELLCEQQLNFSSGYDTVSCGPMSQHHSPDLIRVKFSAGTDADGATCPITLVEVDY